LFSELFVTLAPALRDGKEKRNLWNGNAVDDLSQAILVGVNHSFPSFKDMRVFALEVLFFLKFLKFLATNNFHLDFEKLDEM